MIRVYPKWHAEVKEEIERVITKQANKLNIPGTFIWDSKCIEDCVEGILNVLERLQEEVKGEFNAKQLKDIKKLEEVIKKEETKKGENQIKEF